MFAYWCLGLYRSPRAEYTREGRSHVSSHIRVICTTGAGGTREAPLVTSLTHNKVTEA